MRKFLIILCMPVIVLSCKKSQPGNNTVKQPKLGTKWIYSLKKYNVAGALLTTSYITYTISSEQSMGSENWLLVTDSTGATVFVLKQKTDGLYQFQFGASHLLCKDPAITNETYTTQNNGSDETFLVKAKDYPLTAPFGELLVYYYEGRQMGLLKDIIWYNSEVWFAKKDGYALSLALVNHLDTRLEIVSITY